MSGVEDCGFAESRCCCPNQKWHQLQRRDGTDIQRVWPQMRNLFKPLVTTAFWIFLVGVSDAFQVEVNLLTPEVNEDGKCDCTRSHNQ